MDTNAGVNADDEAKMKIHKENASFYRVVRRIMLAGLGAFALKHDELEAFINRLVERGEIAKKEGESLMEEMKERRNKYIQSEMGYTHERFAEFLDRFSVPTKNDLDALNQKITSLEKKIDKLIKSKQ